MQLLAFSLAAIFASPYSPPKLQRDPAPRAAETPSQEIAEKFRREESEELAKAAKELAERHTKLAKWCEKVRMSRRARFHYLRALSYLPDHEASRKALGYKKAGSVWAEPKEASFRIAENERISPPDNEDEIGSEWKSFEAQLHPILQFRAEKDLKLATKARMLGLPSEEERILRRITQYWPDQVEARKRLGEERVERESYRSGEGRVFRSHIAWVEAKFEKIFQGVGIQGPLKESSEEEQRIGFPLLSLQTEHFRIAASVSEEMARGYIQSAEAAFQCVLALCPEVSMPRKNFPIRLYALGSQEEYRWAVAALVRVGAKELTILQGQANHVDSLRLIAWQDGLNMHQTDLFLHKGAEYAIGEIFPRLSPWFHEGLAYFITYALHGYATTTCIARERGTQAEMVDPWRENKAWRALLLESVLIQDDVPAADLFKAGFNKLRSRGGVKAWSLIHFLRQSDPARFQELLKVLGANVDAAPAIEQVYKLDAKMLDEAWRRWVLESY